MPRYGERPGYEERVEEGSNMAFKWLSGEDSEHIDPATGSFKAGHEKRVEVARQTLGSLGIPSDEIEDSIAVAEMTAIDCAQELQRMQTLKRLGLGGC